MRCRRVDFYLGTLFAADHNNIENAVLYKYFLFDFYFPAKVFSCKQCVAKLGCHMRDDRFKKVQHNIHPLCPHISIILLVQSIKRLHTGSNEGVKGKTLLIHFCRLLQRLVHLDTRQLALFAQCTMINVRKRVPRHF